ncbi:MAG: FAD binding domain-containing protein [Clostridia bacterium]|nr:FAD binding domain-containing protein [Clostridia bacterium]
MTKFKTPAFNRPADLAELADCLAMHREYPDSSYIVAGCTDFLAKRNGNAWSWDVLTDITAIPELKAIELAEAVLRIGAACSHAQIAEDSIVNKRFKALAMACSQIGSPQVRNRGTIGGNAANASPAADTIPVLMAFGAKAVVLNSCGKYRRLAMDQLIAGPGQNTLEAGEALVAFELPMPACPEPFNSAGASKPVSAFVKLGDRTVVTIAKISIALAAEKEAGLLKNVKICIGAAGAKAFHASASEILEGKAVSELLGADGVTPGKSVLGSLAAALGEDIERSIPGRASLAYKKRAVKGLAADLLTQLSHL